MSIGKDVTRKREKVSPLKESEDFWEQRENKAADKQDEKLPEEKPAKFPKELKAPAISEPEEKGTFPFDKVEPAHIKVDAHVDVHHRRPKRKRQT